jgi:hypothetical protein
MIVMMLMTVVPEFGFVEQKEKHQAHEQNREQGFGLQIRLNGQLKGLREQTHEGRGEQRASGQTQKVLGETAQQGVGQAGG